MWLKHPIFMARYWMSAWAINFALAVMPSRAYSRDLRRRILEFRDEASALVLARRFAREAEARSFQSDPKS